MEEMRNFGGEWEQDAVSKLMSEGAWRSWETRVSTVLGCLEVVRRKSNTLFQGVKASSG